MAEIKRLSVGELLRNVLELLSAQPDGMLTQEILAALSQTTPLTEHEKGGAVPANIPRDERIFRLASIPLAKAGWLVKNNKGRWYITEEGREACLRFPNPQDLYTEAVQQYDEENLNPSSSIMVAEQMGEKAWEQIQNHLLETSRIELTTLIADLLRAMSYHVAWTAPAQKERGQIDIVAYTDPIRAKGSRILIQIKHNSEPIALEGLNAFLSVLHPNDYGLVVSSSGFTHEVSEKIGSNAFQRITLLNLEGFFELWIRYYDELSLEAKNRFPLKKIYFLYGI